MAGVEAATIGNARPSICEAADVDEGEADHVSLWPAAPYEYARIAPAGALLFTAGACSLDAAGSVVGVGDIAAQTRRAVENLDAVLAGHGVDSSHIVQLTVYVVADQRDVLAEAWSSLGAWFGPVGPPSTLLGVALLGYPDQLVELVAVAAIPPA
ncbi:MAG: Endoribonuclease [Ilumatobacteraceae bacterium]|nr:Endoribonuclease [Ilumatobacteraceae bacterium]